VNLGTEEWWADAEDLKGRFRQIGAKDVATARLDWLVDMDAICSPLLRKAAKARCAALFRGTLDFQFLEKANYVNSNAYYTLEGIDEIWMWDCFNTEASLGGLGTWFGDRPLRRVPFVWSPLCLNKSCNTERGLAGEDIQIVIGEKNTSSATNCIVPLVGACQWTGRKRAICLLNATELETNHYFQRNIVENGKHEEGETPIGYKGRIA